MERPKFERYNPAVHTDWAQYLNRHAGENSNLAHHFLLNGIFTPLAQDFCQRALDNDNQQQADIYLVGEEPVLRRYSRDLFGMDTFSPLFYRHYASQVARFPTYVHSYCDDFRMESDIRFPVGDYGDRIAYAATQAGRALYGLLQENEESYSAIDNHYWESVQNDTYRSNSFYTMVEGIQSHVTSFALLSSDIVKGFEDDPVGLHDEMVRRKLFKEYSQLTQYGQVIPLAVHGIRYPTPLVNGEQGLHFSDEFLTFLHDERAGNKKSPKALERRLGCPAGKEHTPAIGPDGKAIVIRESGVQLIAEAFSPYLHHFYMQ